MDLHLADHVSIGIKHLGSKALGVISCCNIASVIFWGSDNLLCSLGLQHLKYLTFEKILRTMCMEGFDLKLDHPGICLSIVFCNWLLKPMVLC